MELHRRITKLEKEVNLLKTIQVINDNIQNLHSAIEDYENLGFDINDYKPFLDNYPFGVSFVSGDDKDDIFSISMPLYLDRR